MKYLCYDTALNETYTLVQLLKKYPQYISLFNGTDDAPIWDAAPYLFVVQDNFYELKKDPLIRLDHCILFETDESLEEVCRFLQYYIYKWPGNDRSYFRVWDARVLVRHLPNWEINKRQQFFEFFNCFYTESEQQFFLDKWECGKMYTPMATTVLNTKVLPSYVEFVEGSPSEPVVSANVEQEKDEINAPIEDKTPPKKRRFFIE